MWKMWKVFFTNIHWSITISSWSQKSQQPPEFLDIPGNCWIVQSMMLQIPAEFMAHHGVKANDAVRKGDRVPEVHIQLPSVISDVMSQRLGRIPRYTMIYPDKVQKGRRYQKMKVMLDFEKGLPSVSKCEKRIVSEVPGHCLDWM